MSGCSQNSANNVPFGCNPRKTYHTPCCIKLMIAHPESSLTNPGGPHPRNPTPVSAVSLERRLLAIGGGFRTCDGCWQLAFSSSLPWRCRGARNRPRPHSRRRQALHRRPGLRSRPHRQPHRQPQRPHRRQHRQPRRPQRLKPLLHPQAPAAMPRGWRPSPLPSPGRFGKWATCRRSWT